MTPRPSLGFSLRLVAFFTGLILVVTGHLILFNPEHYGHRLDRFPGQLVREFTRFRLDILPYGVLPGIMLFFLGTLLMAVLLAGRSSQTGESACSIPPVRCNPLRWTGWLGLAVAVGFSLCAAGMLARESPPPAAAVFWFSSMWIWCGWLYFRDRDRDTRPGYPLSGRETGIVLILMLVNLAWVSHDLYDWRWSGTPDEAHFFMTARAFMEGRLDRFILSENGVFGYHPVLSTCYQIFFMRLPGPDGYGWRLSSAFALSVTLPFIYILGRELWNRRTGILAAVIFGWTKIAVGFSHLGYNNVQVYPVLIGSLALFVWACRRRSLTGYFLSGWIAGIGFYTYYAARLAPILTILLGLCLGGLPLIRRDRQRTAVLFLGIMLAVMPLFLHPGDFLAHMLQQTAVTGGVQITHEDVSYYLGRYLKTGEHGTRIMDHWFLTFIHGLYFRWPHHFQTHPVVDPISYSLAFIGLWICLLEMARNRQNRFLGLSFLVTSFVVGAISSHDRPPLTRLLVLSPFLGLLAAVALERVPGVFATSRKTVRSLAVAGVVLITGCVVAWNVTAIHISLNRDHHGYGDGTTGELLRQSRLFPETTQIVYLQREGTHMQCVDLIMDEYGFGNRMTLFRPPDNRAFRHLSKIQPPFAVFLDLDNLQESVKFKMLLNSRFPQGNWRHTDPGRRWSLIYFHIP